jgi:hypothetical protein
MVKSTKNNNSAKEAADKLTGNSPKVVITTIPPEKRYVRRTADEFKAGAEPVRESGSHRFVRQSVTLTPELVEASKNEAESQGVPFTVWVRAAVRKALRDGLDVETELGTEINLDNS